MGFFGTRCSFVQQNLTTYRGYQAKERFLNFHGQHGARIMAGQSIHGQSKGVRSYAFRILSLVFLFAPDVHLANLENIWVDNRVVRRDWIHFVKVLEKEWIEYARNVSTYF